ncbi:MAG: DUF1232 domain-containing protein [Patescibacteria group bacterium]
MSKFIHFFRFLLKHRKTPWVSKALPWIALAYLILPFDLLPDFLPLLGQIDDLVILPSLLLAAYKMIPKEVIEEAKRRNPSIT